VEKYVTQFAMIRSAGLSPQSGREAHAEAASQIPRRRFPDSTRPRARFQEGAPLTARCLLSDSSRLLPGKREAVGIIPGGRAAENSRSPPVLNEVASRITRSRLKDIRRPRLGLQVLQSRRSGRAVPDGMSLCPDCHVAASRKEGCNDQCVG